MNEFRRQMLTPEQSKIAKLGVKEILQAPTQKQLDCPYCNEPFKALYSESDITYGIIDHKVYGVYADSEKLTGLKFTFCPMCGRKLGDD